MFNFFKYTEARLAKEVIQICRELVPGESFHYDDNTHTVHSERADIFLGNLYAQVKHRPARERRHFVTGFLRSALVQQPIDYDSSSHRLIPRVKSTAEFLLWDEQLSLKSHHHLQHRQLTDDFVVMLGLDHETSIHTLMDDDLQKMEMTKDEAFRQALANLYQKSDKPFVEIEPGLFTASADDGHNAARILLTDVIETLQVKGAPVAFLPTSGDLFVCGSEDYEHFSLLAEQCLNMARETRPLTLHTLMLSDGQWQDFYPPKIDEYAPIHNLHHLELATEYSDQKAQLDEYNHSQGSDIEVVGQALYERDDSPFFFSACTWNEQTRILLPQADLVHFVARIDDGETGVLGTLSWQETQEHFGSLMKPLGIVPERYEIQEFPDKKKLLGLIGKQQAVN